MLQVYDRVLPGRSVPTLIALMALATMLYLFQGGLDLVRNRISVRIGRYLDETLGLRVFDAMVRLPLKTRGDGDGLQPLRDLDQVRSFLASGGPAALFDLPWMPIYLGICFLFHFWIGVTALIGALVLVAITVLTETRTRGPTKAYARFAVSRSSLAAEGRRNAEVLQAMDMRQQAALRWRESNQKYLAAHEAASDVASGLGGTSKTFRAILQSLVLAVGAYLVINQESTAGIIIAGSILTARALAPVELAIANWKGFVGARQSGQRLDQLLKTLAQGRGAFGAASAGRSSRGRANPRHGTRLREIDPQRCFVQTVERAGARNHRSQRIRQVITCTGAGGRLAAASWKNQNR